MAGNCLLRTAGFLTWHVFVSSDAAAVTAGHGQTECRRCSENTARKRWGFTRSTTPKEIVEKERGRVLVRWGRTHESKKGKRVFVVHVWITDSDFLLYSCRHVSPLSRISVNVLCQCWTSGKVPKENKTKQRIFKTIEIVWQKVMFCCFSLWQDAQGLLEESRSLEKKVHLASEAQKAAKDVEQDYAEVNNCEMVCFQYLPRNY